MDRENTVTVVPISCANLAQLENLRSAVAARAESVPELRDAGLLLALCLAIGNFDRLRIFEVSVATQIIGWFIGVREPSKATLHIGPVTLFSYAQPRLRMLGDYGFISRSASCDAAPLSQALSLLLQQTKEYDAIFLQAVSSGSILREVVTSLRVSGAVHVRSEYPERMRHRLVPKETFDAYIQSLSKSTRQTFRYSLKKLREYCDGDLTLGVFDAPESIQNFIYEASQIARTTYQQKRLGLGFTNSTGVAVRLRIAAELGWTKSFTLRCRGSPVAYIEGYQAGGTWVAYQIGFVPEWANRSVGTVCQLEAIKYLMDAEPMRPRVIDYLEGDSDFKRRLCNVTTTETSFMITKRSFRASVYFHAQVMLEAIFRVMWRMAKAMRGWGTTHRRARRNS
jgi:hypothetical protein